MPEVIDTDVLVIGLGPAGSCAAAAAAEAGHSVFAIDRKHDAGQPVQCAEFVPGMIGTEIVDLSVAHEQDIVSMLTFVEDASPDVMENFPGHMIDRATFDRHLASLAQAKGAHCQFGVALRSVGEDGVVTLSEGTAVRPKVIVGSDGPKSAVGKAIGQENQTLVETRQLTAELKQPHAATDIFLSADIPGGYAWLFPKGNVANLGIGVRPENKQQLKALLEKLHLQMVEEGRLGSEVLGYTGGPIPVGGMVKPHGRLGDVLVLLAGDAAGLTNPVTGAGINSAVLSGKHAGECATAYLEGQADAAEEYQEDLEDLFGPALARALKRRAEVLAKFDDDVPEPGDLRRGWIAYPEYWAA